MRSPSDGTEAIKVQKGRARSLCTLNTRNFLALHSFWRRRVLQTPSGTMRQSSLNKLLEEIMTTLQRKFNASAQQLIRSCKEKKFSLTFNLKKKDKEFYYFLKTS